MIAWAQRGWIKDLGGWYKHRDFGQVVYAGKREWHAYSPDRHRQWPLYVMETMCAAMMALEEWHHLKEGKR